MAADHELQVQHKREVESKEESTMPARLFLPQTDRLPPLFEPQARRPGIQLCTKIFARSLAASIGLSWCDMPHAAPSARRSIISSPLRPAQSCRKNSVPSPLSTTWYGLLFLDVRIATVPASALKSATVRRVSVP